MPRCDMLAQGFARIRCGDCAFERLLPFSRKGGASARPAAAAHGRCVRTLTVQTGQNRCLLRTEQGSPFAETRDDNDEIQEIWRGSRIAPDAPGTFESEPSSASGLWPGKVREPVDGGVRGRSAITRGERPGCARAAARAGGGHERQ